MTAAVQCEFCPTSSVSFLFASPGVSDESEKICKRDLESKEDELTSARDTSLARVHKANTELFELYKECHVDDWDGRGAAPIPAAALDEATQLIAQIPERFPMPQIIPEPTGEVGLEWYIEPYRVLLLSLSGDGYVYYAGLFGFKDTEHGSKLLAGQLNKKIISLLEEIYH